MSHRCPYPIAHIGSLHIGNGQQTIVIELEHLIRLDLSASTINGAQLQLQKGVQLDQQTLLHIVVKTTYSEIRFIFQIEYIVWISKSLH